MLTNLLLLLLILVILGVEAVSWRKHKTKSLDPGWRFAMLCAWATLFSCKT